MSDTTRIVTQVANTSEEFDLPCFGSPVAIALDIPAYLIDMAKCYPAIDWNEVMRYAIENFDRHRALQPEVRAADVVAKL